MEMERGMLEGETRSERISTFLDLRKEEVLQRFLLPSD